MPQGVETSWPAYFVGQVPWTLLDTFQRRMTYEISGDPRQAAVLFCDHPTGISLGRAGSRLQLHLTDEELAHHGWSIQWNPHGGGVMLHTAGQVACYPQLHLDRLQLTPADYVRALGEMLRDLLNRYDIPSELDPEAMVLRARGRVIASVGVAIRNGVSSFGIVLNVSPDLKYFRDVHIGGDNKPMTSLQRESPHLRTRVPTVRGQLLELLEERFQLGSWTVFHHHPFVLPQPNINHARSAVTR